ncbi:hypothetical protein ABTB82_19020, partial [Acinetobacter baumannii]
SQPRLPGRTLTDGPLFAPLNALFTAGIRIDPEHATHGPGRSPYGTAHNAPDRARCAVAVFHAALSTADGPLSLSRRGQSERRQDEGRGEQ